MTPDEYIEALPEDRREPVAKLRKIIKKNLPKGFQETAGNGFLHWVIPFKTYPAGYHCDPSKPLGFVSIASQKNFIAMYHMGLYGNKKLLEWFAVEWKRASPRKLDMGKSCVRFKKPDEIPYELIGELMTKITPQQWVEFYSRVDPRNRKK
jgi:uncharacterized protein YdhG (YjbR/CyaY superfamily)